MTRLVQGFVSALLLQALVACSESDQADPEELPTLKDVIGADESSRSRAEAVYFRCAAVHRRDRPSDPWCHLRDRISECRRTKCAENSRKGIRQ